jgi:hypothetical protein
MEFWLETMLNLAKNGPYIGRLGFIEKTEGNMLNMNVWTLTSMG